MAKKLKGAIIGCGGIAFEKYFPLLSKLKELEMVAFCDIIVEKAEKAAAAYGSIDAKAFYDYREVLKDVSIDVIYVCTPNDSHAEISIAAMESGKHVMCEKPMAKTAAEAQAMVDAAKRTGKKLSIGYQNNFRPDSRYLQQICDNGELGDIYFAKAHAIRRRAVPTWGVFLDQEKQGGGPLIDIGSHALDLTLRMMNNYAPKCVLGRAYHKLSRKENAANIWGPWDPKKFTVEDSAFGFITMQNGATVILESSWALNSLDTLEAKTTLCGTEGGADMRDGLRINSEKLGRMNTTTIDLSAGGVAFFEGSAESSSDMEARLWLECILHNTEPLVKPEQAFVVTQILEAIYESSKTGKAIYFE
ncbi:Gfo/Idh/MocA family protein [Paenibacillus alginolyticus]|uniref:Gfo/Idh/MocA family oxidoreductase n=1 Tax=Paenibacillus alginolyticus TaxID=59839 RepID=A0ABT4GE61_9BACL|nr:Gfo/Idh/MocA family oxidoreductase [Paenibacillus alginolyticus]MCY9694477.1 Gfo/Idh/MocA family oxidoreductase [Paenibacillus alginolyticus]MEC0142063.1 Gfo/Idh/MocA family oxidoreductase [Paenibacillus alginolyticus]